MAVRYVVQKYERYAIYEPAEGGYYYEGKEPFDYLTLDTKPEAIEALRTLVNEANDGLTREDEGYLRISSCGTGAISINHRYIGDGEEYYVEPINRRGRQREGRVPYC